uniref:FLYWCH-type domain-containing protein n=1 Tax=Panagrolaimus sp. ES5 TaxID=591445 RepID=A0AC34FV99_9BILA
MIYEIKKFQDKKPQLLVYGHIHCFKTINSDGYYVWKCKYNKHFKNYCRGDALTDSMEEDAALIKSPTGHTCNEFKTKKSEWIKNNATEAAEEKTKEQKNTDQMDRTKRDGRKATSGEEPSQARGISVYQKKEEKINSEAIDSPMKK